jgi:ribonucleoside-diphosphate reductase alpha chain
MAWKLGCKGMTVYRKNCRTGVLVDKNDGNNMTVNVHAPKRPRCVNADVYHVTVKGTTYFVLVGLYKGHPYEVFAGKDNGGNTSIDKSVKKAKVVKCARGYYMAIFDNNKSFDNIADQITDDQEAVTRLTSLALRHGNEIGFVVQQLEKVRGEMMCFSKAIARVLKKYIPDGTEVKGETCQGCGADCSLIRQEGCVTCKSCGWSKCG